MRDRGKMTASLRGRNTAARGGTQRPGEQKKAKK